MMARRHPFRTTPMSRDLLVAYLGAEYRIDPDGRALLLHVGAPAPPALARMLPAARYTLVTAWNPRSQPRDHACNHAADAALRTELAMHGLACLRACASDGNGRWHEPGWLVAGLRARRADALARRLGQAGVLHWEAGTPVRLRMYLPRPRRVELHPSVDWPGP